IHNDSKIFQTPGTGNRLQVIRQIYGLDVTKNMVEITDQSLDFNIEGFIAKPAYTRSNRNYMTIIVNGRYIKSNALIHAIVRAYGTLLPIHRYPIGVIAIELDPILVDVNVHPTKLEVRFSKEKELIQILEAMIQKALRSLSLIPKVERKPKQVIQTSQDTFQFGATHAADIMAEEQKASLQVDWQKQVEEAKPKDFPLNKKYEQEIPVRMPNIDDDEPKIDVQEEAYAVPTLYPIGQLQGTYILAQNE